MAASSMKVVLCRGLTDHSQIPDLYMTTIESGGYSCDNLHTSRIQFCSLFDLLFYLRTPESFHGLILTSQRAIEAINLVTRHDRAVLKVWQDMPAYCVGPATESLSKELLNLRNCIGGQSGNAENLARLIISNISVITKPLFYPCSEIVHNTIGKILDDHGVGVEKLTVYCPIVNQSLEHDLLNVVDNATMIFVFFSSSSIEFLRPILKKYPATEALIRMVAIGPSTSRTIQDFGYEVYAISSVPNPTCLLEAIKAAEKN